MNIRSVIFAEKKFSFKVSNLRRHLALLHDLQVKKVKYSYCNKQFQNRENYKTDYKFHHNYVTLSRIGEFL